MDLFYEQYKIEIEDAYGKQTEFALEYAYKSNFTLEQYYNFFIFLPF